VWRDSTPSVRVPLVWKAMLLRGGDDRERWFVSHNDRLSPCNVTKNPGYAPCVCLLQVMKSLLFTTRFTTSGPEPAEMLSRSATAIIITSYEPVCILVSHCVCFSCVLRAYQPFANSTWQAPNSWFFSSIYRRYPKIHHFLPNTDSSHTL